MKVFVIALKDMLRSFRSKFLLMFMLGIPLLVTGMFYVMFGNLKGDKTVASQSPVTQVAVANLDAGDTSLAGTLSAFTPAGSQARSLGELVLQSLQSPELAQLIQVSQVPDAASARAAVDSQQAGLALIIPQDFSAQVANPHGKAALELYQDTAASSASQVLQFILGQLSDSFSSYQITVRLLVGGADPSGLTSSAISGQIYLAALPAFTSLGQGSAASLLDVQSPASGNASDTLSARDEILLNMVGPIMGGMMIFFAFFTASATAQTILKEEEEGTLPRLFTTPTSAWTILQGKFLAVALTVLVQVSALLGASALIFGIPWGSLASVALTVVGTVGAATGFGICFASMLKTVRQGGTITGGLLTMTGMLGMLPIFVKTVPGSSSALTLVSRLVPQGWAVNGLVMGISARPLGEIALNLLGLLGWTIALMGFGVWRFSRRYVKE